jgi:hypothetical protein
MELVIRMKTITRTLNVDRAERYRTWFGNTRRLRQLIDDLEALSVQAIEHTEGWEPR